MFLFALGPVLCAAAAYASPIGLTEPDPALQVSVQLNGRTFINKVEANIPTLFTLTLSDVPGPRRIWPHSVQLYRIHWCVQTLTTTHLSYQQPG